MLQLSGNSIIGFQRGAAAGNSFHGINPSTGDELLPAYFSASTDEVDQAAQLAHQAFESYRQTTGGERSVFLRKIAENIEGIADELVTRATAETALPSARINNEIGRTCNQLRLFAELVAEGSWVDARIDRADPLRTPPKPDVRSMLRPLGPVVVFCASNFPLAFSVAGGDTASALAAGCPVIVKAHHAHPGTAELVGLALAGAVRDCQLSEGVFSLIYGPGAKVGVQLVNHPLIRAGGFTGSRVGGQTLLRLASARPEPIPFYAEMSSVNPIFILPTALEERAEEIAVGLHASVTLGAGQFCTNPGLVFLPAVGSQGLIKRLRELMAETPAFTMLTAGISSAYREGAEALKNNPHVELITPAALPEKANACSTSAALFVTDLASFLASPSMSAEVFGPATLLIKYSKIDDLKQIARELEGQLTATVQASEFDQSCQDLIALIEMKAGRLIFNSFPTGVEVGHAMIHGGPFPATSDGRSTSVGTRAALRFTRPVCYQGWPDAALPDELKDANTLHICRLVDGEMTKDAMSDKL